MKHVKLFEEFNQLNEAHTVEISLRHAKDAADLFNDMFKKYGKQTSTNVFSFKDKDGAIDFVQMLVKNVQVPVGEIETSDKIKNAI